jgi:hypothetical protein
VILKRASEEGGGILVIKKKGRKNARKRKASKEKNEDAGEKGRANSPECPDHLRTGHRPRKQPNVITRQ